ncbi:MAG: dihydrofolate reductase [Alphaproteobacteria bacterium]|nr:dihydrofolate reductase [Alphaproteobacteria bacterium]
MTDARFRLYMAQSLDGFVADAEGGVDWLDAFDDGDDEAVDYGTDGFMDEIDALIMGRATYDQITGFDVWPYAGKRVFVLTSSPIPEAPEGVEATSDVAGLIAELREDAARVWIVGGPGAVVAMRGLGALDTVELFVMPILLGAGVPLFGDEADPLPLSLKSSRAYPNGVVHLVYDVV